MSFIKSLVVSSFFVASIASANCGNNKNVGNGCTDAVVVTPTPVVTPTNSVNIGGLSNANSGTFNNTNVSGGGSSYVASTNNNRNTATGGTANSTANATGGSGGVANVNNNVSAAGGLGGTSNVQTTNTAAGGNATGGSATGGNSNAAVSGNTVQSNSEINVQNNTTSVAPRPPVASAIAPNTIFSGGMDSCMGSSSGSVQGLSFGVAIGSTWTDGHCVALRAAVRLNELGFKNTAAARLCAIPEIAEAFRKSGEFNCGE